MGTKPPTPTFEPGVACAQCEATMFGGVTPKYVEANVQGIVKCPGVMIDPPAGVFLLTQQAAPCFWLYLIPGFFIEYRLQAGTATILIWEAGFWWFSAGPGAPCLSSFVNNQVCGTPPWIGESGTVEIFWGPTIGP